MTIPAINQIIKLPNHNEAAKRIDTNKSITFKVCLIYILTPDKCNQTLHIYRNRILIENT